MKTGIITARVPTALINAIDAMVLSDKVSRSKLIERAIIAMLECKGEL